MYKSFARNSAIRGASNGFVRRSAFWDRSRADKRETQFDAELCPIYKSSDRSCNHFPPKSP